MQIEVLAGPQVEDSMADLARLRLEVFREWPYLYQGDRAYEEAYLAKFLRLPQSTLVVVRHQGRVVGASTALPLDKAEEEFQQPFMQAGQHPAQWYYFGESVLLPAFRGQGLGKRFFTEREERAKALGFAQATFCAVERPPQHPLRPPHYRPLDAFWQQQGFVRRGELIGYFSWSDLGQLEPTAKPMIFWTKAL